ncbi:MAG: hypothetical protein M0042_06140, partial [Nitrospiraceae bacterium]|nr:hypothetical protein [Nitrospiraceae bacterium]
RIRELLEIISPLIERQTATVCPGCVEVCCRQRHGSFTETDHVYLAALGEKVPLHDLTQDPDGPCQFLGPQGCVKPRWQRARKCTWFFCRPLLDALAAGSPRDARMLSQHLEELGRLYDSLKGVPDEHSDR